MAQKQHRPRKTDLALSGQIKKNPKVDLNPKTTFSFEYLDINNNDKFKIDEQNAHYFCKLLERLKALSGFYVNDLFHNPGKGIRSTRCHPLNWSKTTESGFCHLNEQLQDEPAYQFGISVNEHGRVHGLLVDNVFYIIWFDPNHLLWPGHKFN